MSNRRRDRDRDQKDDRRDEAPKPRMSTFFVPGTGIDREVITTDICRYLGNDALVKPGPYQDPRTGEIRQGYFVTAYRALTTEQLADLKADSLRWQQERQRIPAAGRAPAGDGYRGSLTRRQQWGPADTSAEYQGRESFPPKAQPEPSYGQPSYSTTSGYPSGMQPPSAGYPRTEGNQGYPMDTSQNYPQYTRTATVPYGVQQSMPPRNNEADPRASYPSSAGYPTQDQGGRGIPSTGYPGTTYAPYPSDPSGLVPPTGAGRQGPPVGMPYDSTYGQQPVDTRYGRSQPGVPPGAEEGYGAESMDYEDDSMEDDTTGSGYQAQQQSRESRPTRDTRDTPPTKSSRTHHGDRDRHSRR